MIKVLFVCWGNICRSPMAEFVMKDLVEKTGLSDMFYIESAATTNEEIGNPVYPPARAELARHGISCAGKRARRITRRDYDNFDYIVGMENVHIRQMLAEFGSDPEKKLYKLLDFTKRGGEISDPWYTDRFEECFAEILEGCTAMLEKLCPSK